MSRGSNKAGAAKVGNGVSVHRDIRGCVVLVIIIIIFVIFVVFVVFVVVGGN